MSKWGEDYGVRYPCCEHCGETALSGRPMHERPCPHNACPGSIEVKS